MPNNKGKKPAKWSYAHKLKMEKIKKQKWNKEKQKRQDEISQTTENNKSFMLDFFSPFFPKEISAKRARNKLIFFLSLAMITFAISSYMAISYSIDWYN